MSSIFKSAVKQLTAWYVGALFVVCLIFSVPTYYIAMQRLEGGARKQAEIIQRQFGGPFADPYLEQIHELREQQLNRDRLQLLRTIVFIDLFILAVGALLSYKFAEQTLRPIEQAHDKQARFTTDASHELRTPLATMQTEIEVALREKKLSQSKTREVLQSNLEEIDHLRILSEQLLNLSRLNSESLDKSDIPLAKIIKKEVENTKKTLQGEIQQKLDYKIIVKGDENLLKQLVSILLDNAVKYSDAKKPNIVVSLNRSNGMAKISIVDKGIGIKASELPHIFERFYRGSNATRHSSNGHGLGLSLAKQIAEAHNSSITVTSQPGEGTEFQVSLPI